MESTNDNMESVPHESLVSLLRAPPPSPQGFEHQLFQQKMRASRKSRKSRRPEALADKLSSSLATIAREERRKVDCSRDNVSGRASFGVGRQASRGESDEAGDASEESWLSFLGTQSAGLPLVTATTASSSEERYSSAGGRAAASLCRTEAHLPTSDGHGLPMPLDDRVSHGDSHAAVVARLPPPQFKSSSGSSSLSSSSGDGKPPAKRHSKSPHSKSPHSKSPHSKSPHSLRKHGRAKIDHSYVPKAKKLRISRESMDVDSGMSSSGSGTEGGYDASGSSSDNNRTQQSSWSSPSVSSSEEGQNSDSRRKEFIGTWHTKRKMHRSESLCSSGSSSSDLPDFGSSPPPASDFCCSASSSSMAEDSMNGEIVKPRPRKRVHHEEKIEPHVVASRCDAVEIPPSSPPIVASKKIQMATQRRHQGHHRRSLLSETYESAVARSRPVLSEKKPAARHRHRVKSKHLTKEQAPIFSLGCDMMAQVVTFLEPTEVFSLLTTPLSKQWRNTYTAPQDLWRVLCLMEPFKAKFGQDDLDSSDESVSSSQGVDQRDLKHIFGRYRLLYTSFIRCVRYLTQIKDDAIHGRPPSVLDYGGGELSNFSLTSNSGLRKFLEKARGALSKNQSISAAAAAESKSADSSRSSSPFGMDAAHVGVDDSSSVESVPVTKKPKKESKSASRARYGQSMLTQRLLGPSKQGDAGNVSLPWSCAIYSIVNWMVAFSDVEGIQTMCLKVLPHLLEDEQQRTTAQRAGLTDIVLRGMVTFPDSVQLHTAAFHTIVLLARPLGGSEGMLFRSSMVNSSGIFNNGSRSGKNGIAVMLDSMNRFQHEDILQAMSCWSLVNIALAPSQKAVLVKLGGIAATANAMVQHPYNAEVQFRALFALINLVIPSVNQPDDSTEARELQEQLGEVNQTVEKDMLDESVSQIASLVVHAMKHFCSSESILNRACLVLHNLSLTEEYHTTLLWTPCCYQMLEWCLANFRTDQVLQQSAAGTLHRLQQTLARNEELRHQFSSFLQSQLQQSLEQAHQEAILLHEQQEQLLASSSRDA